MPIPTRDTAKKILALLAKSGDGNIGKQRPARRGGGDRVPVLVLCDSVTPADESGVGAQCYPASIIDVNSLLDSQTLTGTVWLTVLGESGEPVVPTVDTPYLGLYAGAVTPGDSDSTRLRVFAAAKGDVGELSFPDSITFLEKLCATNPTISVTKADGYLTGILINGVEVTEGGIPFPLDTSLTPQRKTATLPAGTTITDVPCTGLDDDCCVSTWWCTGPDGDPAWTVVEVPYGEDPPEGGYGPYATEEDADTACVDPEDPGEPVEVACCPDNPVPRTLTITEVGGGSFPLVYNATYGGTGAWLTYPPDDFPDYPGKIPLAGGGGYARIVLNGSGSCTITANLDGNICEGSSAVDPVITCSPFSMTFPLTFVVFGGGSCPCDGETRNFVITE